MEIKDFVFFITKYLEEHIPYKESNIEERFRPIVNKSIKNNLSISLFTHTVLLIKFYANRVILENKEEVEFVYNLIFDYIDLCINETSLFVHNRLQSYTTAPRLNKNHRNRIYCGTNHLLHEILSRGRKKKQEPVIPIDKLSTKENWWTWSFNNRFKALEEKYVSKEEDEEDSCKDHKAECNDCSLEDNSLDE